MMYHMFVLYLCRPGGGSEAAARVEAEDHVDAALLKLSTIHIWLYIYIYICVYIYIYIIHRDVYMYIDVDVYVYRYVYIYIYNASSLVCHRCLLQR